MKSGKSGKVILLNFSFYVFFLLLPQPKNYARWCNYYRHVCSKRTFTKIDHEIHKKLWQWAKRRHRNKGKTWIKKRYWHKIGNNQWRFAVMNKRTRSPIITLLSAGKVKIIRHVKIKGEANPYLPSFEQYFNKRLLKRWELMGNNKKEALIKRQQGKCPICHEPICPEDRLEIDHKIPKCEGGTDNLSNLRLVCYSCHKQIHSRRKTLYIE